MHKLQTRFHLVCTEDIMNSTSSLTFVRLINVFSYGKSTWQLLLWFSNNGSSHSIIISIRLKKSWLISSFHSHVLSFCMQFSLFLFIDISIRYTNTTTVTIQMCNLCKPKNTETYFIVLIHKIVCCRQN